MLLPTLRVHTQPLSTGSMAIFPYSEGLAKRFALTTRFGEPYCMFEKCGDRLLLPRAVAPLGALDQRVQGEPITVSMVVGPKDEQQYRIVAEQDALIDQRESFIVEAKTGTGKTYFACAAVARAQRKTLIVVPKQDLMDQFRARLQQFLGLKPHQIGTIQADKVDVQGKPVVLGMIHSLALPERYPQELLNSFGLVLIDEVHRSSATSLSKFFKAVPAAIRIGYSATPKRADGKEQVIYAHIGPVRVVGKTMPMVPKIMAFHTGHIFPRVIRKDDFGRPRSVIIPHQPGRIMPLLKHMATSPKRNELVASLAKLAYDKGRYIILFTDTLEHIDALQAACRYAGIPMADLGIYVGGMSADARENSSKKRVVCATYGMMKEGTDWPWFDCAILTTPKSDVEQAAGRVLRQHPDKRPPLIIDMIDEDSVVLAGYWRKRKAWYESIKAEILTYSS